MSVGRPSEDLRAAPVLRLPRVGPGAPRVRPAQRAEPRLTPCRAVVDRDADTGDARIAPRTSRDAYATTQRHGVAFVGSEDRRPDLDPFHRPRGTAVLAAAVHVLLRLPLSLEGIGDGGQARDP